MQSTANNHVGESIPGRPTCRAGRPVSFVVPDLHSNLSEHKLLTAPLSHHHHPPKKIVISSFMGIEASESKNPLGDHFIGKKNGFTRDWASNIMPWGMLRE